MAYNMTQLQAADTLYKIFAYANDSTGGFLIGGLMIAVFFVLLMSLKRYDFDDTLLTSSFISFILSLPLVFAKLLNGYVCFVFFIMAAFMIGWKYWDSRSN